MLNLLTSFLDRAGAIVLVPIDAFWNAFRGITAAGQRVFKRIAGKAEVPIGLRNMTHPSAAPDSPVTFRVSPFTQLALVAPESDEGGSSPNP